MIEAYCHCERGTSEAIPLMIAESLSKGMPRLPAGRQVASLLAVTL